MAATTSTPSSFSARNQRALLPSNLLYEPLCRYVLRKRLLKVFYYTGGFAALVTSALLIVFRADLSWFSLIMNILFYSAYTFFTAVVPVLVLRKRSLAATSVPQPTAWAELKSQLPHPRTWQTIVVFASSAGFMSLAYPGLLGQEWSLFSPTARHPWHLNERFIFLAGGSVTAGIAFAVNDLAYHRWTVKWATAGISPQFLSRIIPGVTASNLATIPIVNTVLYTLVYFIFRKSVWQNLLHFPILGSLLRPFVINFLRPSHSLASLGLFWKLFLLSFVTALQWECAEIEFDFVSSNPIQVTNGSPDPNQCLISGITSPNPYYQHFAFIELLQLARTGKPARRTAIFTDNKSTPTTWNTIVRQSLLILGNDYQTLLRRGQPLPPPPPPAERPAQATQVPKTPSQVVRTQIFKQQQRSPTQAFLDSLASSNLRAPPTATPTPATGSSAPPPVSTDASVVPAVFLSRTQPPPVKAAPVAASQVVAVQKGTGEKVGETLMKWTRDSLPEQAVNVIDRAEKFWFATNMKATAEACFPNRVIDVLAIEVLCHMVAVSLTEDPHGVVQRDIPKILEALLSFLQAVEEYQEELATIEAKSSPQDSGAIKEALDEVTQPTAQALRVGISLIAQTFKDRLSAFRFPPRTAKKLQIFVDYL